VSATAQNYVYEVNVRKGKKLDIPVASKEKMESAKAVMQSNLEALTEYRKSVK